jgi:hypothetical protein
LFEQDLDENEGGERISAGANRDIGQPPQSAVGDGCAEQVHVQHAPWAQVTRELPGRGKGRPEARVFAADRNEPHQHRKCQSKSQGRNDNRDQRDERAYSRYSCAVPGELYRTADDHAATTVAHEADLKECQAIGQSEQDHCGGNVR